MSIRTTIMLLALVTALGGFILWSQPGRPVDERNIFEFAPSMRLDPEQINTLSVEAGGNVYHLEKSDQRWRLVHPVEAAANESAVLRLIDALVEARWTQHLTEADQKEADTSPADYGLAPGRATITLGAGDIRSTLMVGRLSADGREMYVRRGDLASIFVTTRDIEAALPASELDLRDRRLIHITPDRVRRVEWLTRQGPLEVARNEDNHWRLVRPVNAAAHDAAVRQWLDKLYEFRIHEFIAESMAAASLYGFDAPHRQLILTGPDAGAPYVLKIGQAVNAAETEYYASISGQEQVFSVSREVVDWLDPRMRDFRDYRLCPFNASEVTGIEMIDDERVLQIRLATQQVWEITSPNPMPVAAQKVAAFLEAWTGTPVEEFIDPPHSDLSIYGLDITNRTLRLLRAAAESDPGFPLIIGATNTTGAFYAKTPTGPVMELPSTLLDFFHATPLPFRDDVVFSFAADEITRIAQTIAGITYAVEAVDGQFRPVVPGFAPDTDAIQGLLFRGSRIEASRLIAENPTDLAIYGLDPPYAQIIFGMATGGMQRVLLLGHTADDGTRYATQQGIELVFTMTAESGAALLQPVAHPEAPVLPPPGALP